MATHCPGRRQNGISGNANGLNSSDIPALTQNADMLICIEYAQGSILKSEKYLYNF